MFRQNYFLVCAIMVYHFMPIIHSLVEFFLGSIREKKTLNRVDLVGKVGGERRIEKDIGMIIYLMQSQAWKQFCNATMFQF